MTTLFLLFLLLFSFSPVLVVGQTVVKTGFGPEDLVVDSLNTPPRILISCAGRRAEYPEFGEIQTFYPESGIVETLPRLNEPAGLFFRPHGISLLTQDSQRCLFVISHDDNTGHHPIIRYQVTANALIFDQIFDSPLLVSPNAVQAYPDGTLLVCNDASKRGSKMEMILGLKTGNIIRYDGKGSWTVVASKLGMPAGMAGFGDQLFVSACLENRLYAFTYCNGNLTNKRLCCAVKGGDNIRVYPEFLLTTSHARMMKFVAHAIHEKNPSPSCVMRIYTKTGACTVLYNDNGRSISTASAAVLWKDELIVGQIFEPHILVNKLH